MSAISLPESGLPGSSPDAYNEDVATLRSFAGCRSGRSAWVAIPSTNLTRANRKREKERMLRTTLALVVLATIPVDTSFAQQRSLTDAEKRIITNTYGSRLKDPLSAQYRWPNLIKAQAEAPDYCFQVNAKNSYGAYVGFQTVLGSVSQRNGTIVSYSFKMGAESSSMMNDTANQFCAIGGYKFQ
ncbi:hypothetical protein IVB13_11815 [Bradyrhizobium sp. 17]|nr:hypothetical protein [Bradyrhizobium sp. 17]